MLKELEPVIGRHLANLNLFREADGKVYITVASGGGAIAELDEQGKRETILPIDYISKLIIEAANNMAKQTRYCYSCRHSGGRHSTTCPVK